MKLNRLAMLLTSFALFAQQPVGSQRVLGVLSPANEDLIVAPDKVRVGQEFTVSVTTIGGGCDEEGDNGVIVGNAAASIHVYDFSAANQPNAVCPAIVKQFRHDVPLSFTEPGQAVIRVWGRRTGRYFPDGGAPTVLEVRVEVAP
jgi:hypothetical protein